MLVSYKILYIKKIKLHGGKLELMELVFIEYSMLNRKNVRNITNCKRNQEGALVEFESRRCVLRNKF